MGRTRDRAVDQERREHATRTMATNEGKKNVEMTTTTTGKGSIVDATNIVSNRSPGSLASVGDMFGQQKQKLTGSAVFAIFVGAIAGLLFGFDQNVFNLIFDETAFRATMGMPPAVEQCGPAAGTEPLWVSNRIALIQALYPIGCAAASPFAGTMNDRFGRYKTLWVGMVIFFLGASLQTAANDWPMLMAGRVIAGMSVGILSSVVPVYIGELAPAHLRGGLGSLFQVGITFGAVFATVWCMILQSTIHGVNYVWRLETGMQLVIGLVMAVSMLFIPESPGEERSEREGEERAAQAAGRRWRGGDGGRDEGDRGRGCDGVEDDRESVGPFFQGGSLRHNGRPHDPHHAAVHGHQRPHGFFSNHFQQHVPRRQHRHARPEHSELDRHLHCGAVLLRSCRKKVHARPDVSFHLRHLGHRL